MAPLPDDNVEEVAPFVEEQEVGGEGQEALWIEEEHSTTSPSASSTGTPVKTTSRGFFKKSPKGPENSGSSRNRLFRRKKVVQGHSVVLLEQPVNVKSQAEASDEKAIDLTVASSESSEDPQSREITTKATSACSMLDEALALKGDDPQSLAKFAFAEAVSARLMVDPKSSTLTQYKVLQEKGGKIAAQTIANAQENKTPVSVAEANKAKSILSEILPPTEKDGSAVSEVALASPLSISSLNDILDAPEEGKAVSKKSFSVFGGPARGKKPIERFSAQVVDSTKEDTKEMENAVANIEELEKISNLDSETADILKEALRNDDTESLSSYDGVKLFGGPATKDEKKSKSVEEPDPEMRAPPRDLTTAAPMFISVTPGEADVLTQKSWDVLMEQDAVDPMFAPGAAFEPDQPRTVMSPVSEAGGADEDRYTVQEAAPVAATAVVAAAAEDKYSVVPGEGAVCDALCGPTDSDVSVQDEEENMELKGAAPPGTSRQAASAVLADEVTTLQSEDESQKDSKPKRKLFGFLKRGKSKSVSVEVVNEEPADEKETEKTTSEKGPKFIGLPTDLTREQTLEQTVIETALDEIKPPVEEEGPEEVVEEPPKVMVPSDLTRDETFERTVIETSWKHNSSPGAKAKSPSNKDPLIARLRGKGNKKKTRQSVDP